VILQLLFLFEVVEAVVAMANSMLVVRVREMELESLLELWELMPRWRSSFLTRAVAVRRLEEKILLAVVVLSLWVSRPSILRNWLRQAPALREG